MHSTKSTTILPRVNTCGTLPTRSHMPDIVRYSLTAHCYNIGESQWDTFMTIQCLHEEKPQNQKNSQMKMKAIEFHLFQIQCTLSAHVHYRLPQ